MQYCKPNSTKLLMSSTSRRNGFFLALPTDSMAQSSVEMQTLVFPNVEPVGNFENKFWSIKLILLQKDLLNITKYKLFFFFLIKMLSKCLYKFYQHTYLPKCKPIKWCSHNCLNKNSCFPFLPLFLKRLYNNQKLIFQFYFFPLQAEFFFFFWQ